MPNSARSDGYVVLMGHMVEDMGLSGSELVAYAIIYGFCQADCPCECSLRYFRFWLGCSKSTVIRILDSLEAKGFIARDRKTVNGVPFTSYRLGPNAVAFVPAKPEVFNNRQVDGWCQDDTTGLTSPAPAAPAAAGSRPGGGVKMTPPVPKLDPINKTDTDSDSDSDSDSEFVFKKKSIEGFNALKAFLPNTDGASFGYANYCALLKMGYERSRIERAMSDLADSMREDYPDRRARFFPHAERLLDPKNPSGIMRFLESKTRRALPDDKKLLVFALTRADRDTCLAVERLNDAVANAASIDGRKRAVEERRAWLEENRERLIELWVQAHSKDGR